MNLCEIMKLEKWAVALMGVVLFIYILSRVDISKVISILSGINPYIFSLALALVFLLIALKAFKWKLILKSIGGKITFTDSLKFYFIGLFISNITPGKVGDFAKALYIRHNTRLPAGIASVFVDRLMDIGILLFFCAISVSWFIYRYHLTIIPPEAVAVAVLGFLAALAVFLREKYLKAFLRPLFHVLVPERHKENVSAMFSDFFSAVKSVKRSPVVFVSALVLGVAIWLLGAAVFYLTAISLSIWQPMHVMFMVYPLMALADLLPISFSGIGTRDAILIFLFSFFSMGAESAVSLSFLVFFSGYALVSFIGFVLFVSNPIRLEF